MPSFPFRHAFLGLAILVAAGLAILAPWPLGGAAAAVLVTLALWGTGLVPPWFAALVFFAAVLILGLATPEVIFRGFSSAAVWLIVSGFVIGAAIRETGLGARIAGALAPLAGGSYLRLLAVMTLAAMALGFVMPSSVGRSVALIPIGMALAERMGFSHGTKARTGIAVALTLACNMPSFAILPSNIPNMILAGAAETQHGVRFDYASYLMLHYPLLGIVKSAITVLLVAWIFGEEAPAATATATAAAPGSATPAAGGFGPRLRLGVILAGTLALWMTDSLHGVGPAWIGLGTAVLLLAPGIGVLAPAAFNGAVDFGIVLFVAAALGLGALVNDTGLGAIIGGGIESVLPLSPGAGLVDFLSLSVLSAATGLATTNPGAPAVLTPMAPELARATGMSLEAVLMTQVIGFSTVIFPYQVGPLVLAMQLAGEKVGQVVRVTAPLALVTYLVLVPLDWAWWRLLGWL